MAAAVGLKKNPNRPSERAIPGSMWSLKRSRPLLADCLYIKLWGADLAVVRPLIHIAAPWIQRFSIPRGDRVLR